MTVRIARHLAQKYCEICVYSDTLVNIRAALPRQQGANQQPLHPTHPHNTDKWEMPTVSTDQLLVVPKVKTVGI